MRTLLKAVVDVEAGNKAVSDGTMGEILASVFEMVKPEASYFFPENGKRSAWIIFDLKDPSQIPLITEPLFLRFKADVSFTPVMNLEDLQRGLRSMAESKR